MPHAQVGQWTQNRILSRNEGYRGSFVGLGGRLLLAYFLRSALSMDGGGQRWDTYNAQTVLMVPRVEQTRSRSASLAPTWSAASMASSSVIWGRGRQKCIINQEAKVRRACFSSVAVLFATWNLCSRLPSGTKTFSEDCSENVILSSTTLHKYRLQRSTGFT